MSERSLVRHDEGLWSTEYQLGWPAGLIPIPVRMTVLRLADGRLILHSPAPLSAELRDELDALGPVAFIVIPRVHGKFAGQASQSYPSARLLAAPSPPSRRASLPFHGSLADQAPAAWAGQVESLLVRGSRRDEVVLFHRSSRTLVLTDLCFNIQRSSSRIARLLLRANGAWRRFGPSRMLRLLVSDRAAFERSLERVLEWNFERIVPGHGDVLEQGGPAALRAAWLGASVWRLPGASKGTTIPKSVKGPR